MNIPFTLADAALDKPFLAGSQGRRTHEPQRPPRRRRHAREPVQRDAGGGRRRADRVHGRLREAARVSAMTSFKIRTLNSIAVAGLDRLPRDRYEVASEIGRPDAILLRSFKMHDMALPDSLLAVGRAGAGTNNIPVAKLSKLGVPVFNTPGANANAVKELVIAGLLMAARNLPQALDYVRTLKGSGDELDKAVESGKKQFVGFELPKRTLGVVGLGAIGVEVANAALKLGMNVLGYDPSITVQHAWQLSSGVQKAVNLDDLFARADVVTVHVPLTKATDKLVNARAPRSHAPRRRDPELLARRHRRFRRRHRSVGERQAARVRHGLPDARAARSARR